MNDSDLLVVVADACKFESGRAISLHPDTKRVVRVSDGQVFTFAKNQKVSQIFEVSIEAREIRKP